jgi:hypothetical protein
LHGVALVAEALPVVLFQGGSYELGHLRDVDGCRAPHDVEINLEIVVDQLVAETRHLLPRDLGVRLYELDGELARCLAENLKLSNQSVLQRPLMLEVPRGTSSTNSAIRATAEAMWPK